MTARKVIVLFVCAVCFLLIPVRGVQWLALTFFVVIILSYIYSKAMFVFFSVRHRYPLLRTYRYQDVELSLILENKSPIPFHHVTVIFPCGLYERNKSTVMALRAGERKDFQYRLICDKRGEYRIGPVRAKGGDPLGLFPWEKLYNEITTVIVYPALYDVALINNKGLPSGNLRIANPMYEDVTRYRSIRDYMPGDDPRIISWKVTARTGKLASLQYLPVFYFPVIIVLNITAAHYPLKHRHSLVERAIETAASLARYAVSLSQGVGLVTTGKRGLANEHFYVPVGYGHQHVVTILETLACINLADGNDDILTHFLNPDLRLPWGTRLFYVGPAPDASQIDFFFSLRQKAGVDIGIFPLTSPKESTQLSRLFSVYEVKEFGNELI
ncbi:MAG: DUF58 domain-containing protein [Spirochaetes bacterium]|nr:DUF58 domain-containing protein [Spirochaetota bacterium]